MQNKSKPYSTISLFMRSLILSVLMAFTSFLQCVVTVAVAPLSLRIRYRVTMIWVGAMLWLLQFLCHIRYQVEGWQNVKKIKNGIIMSKHQSAWETLFLATSFKEAAFIVKKELLWFPFFGWGLALLSPIAINRKKTKSAMQQIILQGKRCLKTGRWIIIFPEGTRIPFGQIGKYRIGGARLAVETGYPIIPVAHNAGRYWPRRGFIKKPGLIRIVFGPPIDPQGQTAEEVLERTKTWIEETMLKIE